MSLFPPPSCPYPCRHTSFPIHSVNNFSLRLSEGLEKKRVARDPADGYRRTSDEPEDGVGGVGVHEATADGAGDDHNERYQKATLPAESAIRESC